MLVVLALVAPPMMRRLWWAVCLRSWRGVMSELPAPPVVRVAALRAWAHGGRFTLCSGGPRRDRVPVRPRDHAGGVPTSGADDEENDGEEEFSDDEAEEAARQRAKQAKRAHSAPGGELHHARAGGGAQLRGTRDELHWRRVPLPPPPTSGATPPSAGSVRGRTAPRPAAPPAPPTVPYPHYPHPPRTPPPHPHRPMPPLPNPAYASHPPPFGHPAYGQHAQPPYPYPPPPHHYYMGYPPFATAGRSSTALFCPAAASSSSGGYRSTLRPVVGLSGHPRHD